MTRIIAGVAGGRRLAVPRGTGTRPTSDRVRESMFSRLESLGAVDGARVLDLYAGSGALGLEAVSRGAVSAVLVEADRRAADLARRNARDLGLDGVRVVTDRVERYLSTARRDDEFDLVLCDPPYALAGDTLAAVLAELAPVVAAGGVVAVERSARAGEPRWPATLSSIGGRRTGETSVWLAASRPAS
ncbi:MAG: 16S rRNA (guanine(966)-N(2))-methyltransferase RsmD [Kineosporiaceae bacterium]